MKKKFDFEFNLTIEWIYEKREENNQFHFTGFMLKMEGKEKITFFSKNFVELQKINFFLKDKINQFNFHDYYKAIKKIGKGNFANVCKN